MLATLFCCSLHFPCKSMLPLIISFKKRREKKRQTSIICLPNVTQASFPLLPLPASYFYSSSRRSWRQVSGKKWTSQISPTFMHLRKYPKSWLMVSLAYMFSTLEIKVWDDPSAFLSNVVPTLKTCSRIARSRNVSAQMKSPLHSQVSKLYEKVLSYSSILHDLVYFDTDFLPPFSPVSSIKPQGISGS